jgi:hypothetical protein
MRIYEILAETRSTRHIIKDVYGGILKFEPDPTTIITPYPKKFSMAYINPTIARFYNVDNRLIGFDSHGHLGMPQPHLHAFTRNNRSGYYDINHDVMKNLFSKNIEIFQELYVALINRYTRDTNNGNNRTS